MCLNFLSLSNKLAIFKPSLVTRTNNSISLAPYPVKILFKAAKRNFFAA